MKKMFAFTFLLAHFCQSPLNAQARLGNLFTDNMVLQQRSKPAIWGWTLPNKLVSVTSSWNKKTVSTQTDSKGKWKIALETPGAGGPYTLTISDGKPVTLTNVMIG